MQTGFFHESLFVRVQQIIQDDLADAARGVHLHYDFLSEYCGRSEQNKRDQETRAKWRTILELVAQQI